MPLAGKSFFVHQGRERLSVVRDVLQRTAAKRWRVGATIFLPRYMASTGATNAGALDPHAIYVLGDPETRRMITPYAKRGRGKKTHPYLAINHAVSKQAFVDGVLDAQVAAGRRILISPWLIHGVTPHQRDLDLTIEYARLATSSSRIAGRTLFIGVEATEQVFADDAARNDMLDKLVELPEHPFYLRMTCPGQPSRLGYSNRRALAGLRV